MYDFSLQESGLHFCHISSLTEQEQEASQRDVNIGVSEVTTAANDATDEARVSRDVALGPF